MRWREFITLLGGVEGLGFHGARTEARAADQRALISAS